MSTLINRDGLALAVNTVKPRHAHGTTLIATIAAGVGDVEMRIDLTPEHADWLIAELNRTRVPSSYIARVVAGWTPVTEWDDNGTCAWERERRTDPMTDEEADYWRRTQETPRDG